MNLLISNKFISMEMLDLKTSKSPMKEIKVIFAGRENLLQLVCMLCQWLIDSMRHFQQENKVPICDVCSENVFSEFQLYKCIYCIKGETLPEGTGCTCTAPACSQKSRYRVGVLVKTLDFIYVEKQKTCSISHHFHTYTHVRMKRIGMYSHHSHPSIHPS